MKRTTFLLLSVFIVLFIFVRSINYIYHLNWSGDQASTGIDALRIWRTHTPTLIGPQISANLQGRFIFQGPFITYFFLLFLLLGHWDPVVSSYLFMLFCALMIIPLYIGVKKMINEKAAYLTILIYSFIPYYINYTRFLWNSTLLFALLPILILLMGLFRKNKNWLTFLSLSFWLGFLLQFHYQFIVVIIGVFLYYFFIKKVRPMFFLLFVLGIAIGFSPLILFELKHSFYNLKTIILFVQNWKQVDKPGGLTMPHYYITISFMLILTLIGMLAKRINKISTAYLFVFGLILFIYGTLVNIPRPIHAFWAPASPWNYSAEKKIYDIIRSSGLKKDFNVANLAYYDTPAIVVKYFMKRDGYQINYDDYYQNKYLFVVSEDEKYKDTKSYEVATFQPRQLLHKWQINEKFNLFLFERIEKNQRV